MGWLWSSEKGVGNLFQQGIFMASRELERISNAILDRRYTLTEQEYDEMEKDNFDVLEVEAAILTGAIDQVLTMDPRGPGYVVLEDVPIGLCDKCGARYFHPSILRRVAEIGRGPTPTARTIEIPVDRYAPA